MAGTEKADWKGIDLYIVIPTLNEERHLSVCLDHIGSFAPVLVVDSGSCDLTRTIAQDYGAKVETFSWNGAYPKKKNWVILNDLVKSEWILFLDADEFITEAFKQELGRTLPGTANNGFWLTYENYFLGQRLKHGIPFRKLFLLRNGYGQFQRVRDDGWTSMDMEVHEQLEIDGGVGVIKSPIIHQNMNSLEHQVSKHREYAIWEARCFLAKDGFSRPSFRQRMKRLLLNTHLLGPGYFFFSYIFRLGFLDGKAGLQYALLKASYFRQIKRQINALQGKAHER